MNPVQGYFPLGAGLPAHFVAFVWRVFVHLMCSKSSQKFLMHLHLASGGVIDRFPPLFPIPLILCFIMDMYSTFWIWISLRENVTLFYGFYISCYNYILHGPSSTLTVLSHLLYYVGAEPYLHVVLFQCYMQGSLGLGPSSQLLGQKAIK